MMSYNSHIFQSAITMYELSWQLHRDNVDLLWLVIFIFFYLTTVDERCVIICSFSGGVSLASLTSLF